MAKEDMTFLDTQRIVRPARVRTVELCVYRDSIFPCEAWLRDFQGKWKIGTEHFIHSKVFMSSTTWLPCSAAVHQYAQVSRPLGPHSRSSSQEFGTQAVWCVSKKLMTSPFPSFLNDQLEVSNSSKRLVRLLMIVTDLLQNGSEDKMFGHPIRDALDSAPLIQWFPYDDTQCHVVTWYGQLTTIVSNVGVAVKIACFRHVHVDGIPVNTGKGALRTIGDGIVPCKVWLLNFRSMWETGTEHIRLPCITFCECVVRSFETSLPQGRKLKSPILP